MQNRSDHIPAISTIAPPSYTEATGISAWRNNSTFDQRYPHMNFSPSHHSAPHSYTPYSNIPVQTPYPDYELEQNQQNQLNAHYGGTLIVEAAEDKNLTKCIVFSRILWVGCSLVTIIAILVLIIRASSSRY
ncbi:uncharacterized protein LOC105424820 [Pogonomyrmex barbatus]|uniref:Uncharacterized protein LOC105424820 n=1 Tax=Pogonomyrmex barbatus TaxID=144034 RepID=A0A6I9VYR2_9HYME|nr:uncharacterized protein LOC105424820 [Pogonomyrmex barbatus]